MNQRLILAIVITAISSLVMAGDKTLYTYEGEVAGVVCSACSGHVKAALSKLEGVTTVKISLGKEGSAPRLEVTSTSPHLTNEAAVKALGTDAEMYHIRNLRLAGK